jgi:Carboxypeptidase regulatory-like domain
MTESSAATPNLLPVGHYPIAPPPGIMPKQTTLSLISGQTATATFTVTGSTAAPQLGPLPAGITGSVTQIGPELKIGPELNYELTLAATPGMSPVNAEIELTVAGGVSDAKSTVSLNAKAQGAIFPSYMVAGMLYSPPGTDSGHSTSQVSYGTGSTTGTTVSAQNTFKTGVDLSATVGVNAKIGSWGINASVTGDYSQSGATSSTDSISVTKTTTHEIDIQGPAEDGINHDHDVFLLWLNPVAAMTVDASGNVSWNLAFNGPAMIVQYVYVGWLKNPALMQQEAPGVAQALANAGLTQADYENILSLNPFSNGGTEIDPDRFVLASQSSFPYEPPLTAADPVVTSKLTLTSATTDAQTTQVTKDYKTSITGSAGFSVAFVSVDLKASGSWEWTTTSTRTSTSTATQSATATVGGPAAGYAGSTDILVYWDVLFSCFMFAYATGAPAAVGTVIGSDGAPAVNQEVTVTRNGVTHSTFTDARGQYRLYGITPGPATVTVAGRQFTAALGSGTPPPMLQLTSAGSS